MSPDEQNAVENTEQSSEGLAHNTEPDAGDLMIRVCDVWKSFGDTPVLKGISLEVKAHETVGIIGLSGCGKSTLLRIISGLETADRGEIHLADPNYSLVFQYSALFDSLTVFENVAFSLMEKPDIGSQRLPEALQPGKARSGRYRMKQIREIVAEKLKMVGLEGIEEQYPSSLSGGMKKRVSFARAIVSNPRIILYDEPTAGLDPIASTVIEDYMVQMRNELNAASMVVTHQFSTINRTDRLILLHEGEVCWEGTPKELYNSSNPFAHQFANASLDGPMTQDSP
jgi:phospholipid/cholesterol/gamma-HCH transport system ATP-binding protein